MRSELVLILALVSCIPQPVDPTQPTDSSQIQDLSSSVDAAPIVTAYRLTPYKTKYTTPETSFTQQSDGVFWDSQLQAKCYPQLAADGVQRCLPLYGAAYINSYFSDVACTQSVVLVELCNTPKFVYSLTGCPSTYSFSQISTKIVPTPLSYYVKNGMTCANLGVPPGYDVYRVGPALPPSTFVAVKTEQVP